MKIKYKPRDFIVKEVTHVCLVHKGPYSIYELTKRNIDAFSIKKILEKRFHTWHIGMAGLKDRHALTTQLISIRGVPLWKNYAERNFSLRLRGFSLYPIRRGDIIENKFRIVIRDISQKEINTFTSNLALVKKQGFINYFGDQRFIHASPAKKLIIEPYVRGDVEKSVRLYLTLYRKKDKKEIKESKKLILKNWGNWEKCLTFVLKGDFVSQKIIKFLQKGKSFEKVLRLIPKELLEMYVLSYLSFLWNKNVSEYIQKWKHVFVKTGMGELAFPREIIPSKKIIIIEIPKKIGVLLKKISFPQRKMLAPVRNLKYTYEKKNLILTFSLMKGCYATTLLKTLFEK